MFENIGNRKAIRNTVTGRNKETEDKLHPRPSSTSSAGPTPFHRAQSFIPRDTQTTPRFQFRWLIFDNNGSFNGWFDWLPLWMRVGYWSPVVIIALVLYYGGLIWWRPRPLVFESMISTSGAAEEEVFGIPKSIAYDLCLFLWGIFVVVYAKINMGSIWWLFISFTGWSWSLLTLRAGLEFGAWATSSILEKNAVAMKLAFWGSALRFAAVTNASIVCAVWNAILLPVIYFVSMPPGEKRENFRKFNFGFFMTNIHVLNFPMAVVNTVYGTRIRVFTVSDLWVGYFVLGLYSILYFFVMDRIGMHFYPILCPRTAFCVVSIAGILGLKYYLFLKWNELISPDTIGAK